MPFGLPTFVHLLLDLFADPPSSPENSAPEILAWRDCTDGSTTVLLEDDALVVAEAPTSCRIEEARAGVARVRTGSFTDDVFPSEAPRSTGA